ncbi:MAG TPA: glycosyltransferase family 4 protein [Rhodothermales bacterium]
MRRVCIQWPRFGPYHLARLETTHSFLATQGAELVALETAGTDATYAWRVEDDERAFRRVRVFPDRVFEELDPKEVDREVQRKLDELQPDGVAIHSYSFPDARACLSWCRRNRRVAVVMTDSREDDGPRVGWRELIKRLIVSQYDAGLVAGTPQRAYLQKLGLPADRIFLGYDVVDNDFFERAAEGVRRDAEFWRRRLDLPGSPFFVSVNRLLPYKNVDGLLVAYRQYRERAANPWPLVIVGDGPDRVRLETIVRERRIEGVHFAGFRQIDDLPAYYALAGALVHPTFRDTWGLTVNEAMATGLPVIVSDRAGCVNDLVAHGRNGFRFDPADTSRLAELLTEMASDKTDRTALGNQARTTIAGWSLSLFAESLWAAMRAGAATSQRGMNPLAAAAIRTLALTAREVHSFQALRI